MLDICLLGTGGMMPLPYRWLTSLVARYNGKNVLIDCGEGTQIALREKGISPHPIDVICITHFHADHISGLPGLLLTIGNAERTQPLTIIGPSGLTRVVNSLRVIAPEIPFQINCVEIEGDEQEFSLAGLRIKAFKVNHSVTCYGYSIEVDRLPKFDPEKARNAGIEIKYWNALQHGQQVTTEDGRELVPEMVMGPGRKGLKVTYVTDSRPTASIVKNAAEADLFICEGMYGDQENIENARSRRHMMFSEAATIAKDANVKEMWLTHYSPSLIKPEPYMEDTRKIFKNSFAGKDGKSVELKFEE